MRLPEVVLSRSEVHRLFWGTIVLFLILKRGPKLMNLLLSCYC